MSSAAETLAKISGALSVPIDQSHAKLRSEVEERIQGLRTQAMATRIDTRFVNSAQVGPTLAAIAELMRGGDNKQAPRSFREYALQEDPSTAATPLIFTFDVGQYTNYTGIGFYGANMVIDITEAPAAVPSIDMVVTVPRPRSEINLSVQVQPTRIYHPRKQMDIEARDRALRSLASGGNSLFNLVLLDELSKVHAGILEKPKLMGNFSDKGFTDDLEAPFPSFGQNIGQKIIRHSRSGRRSNP